MNYRLPWYTGNISSNFKSSRLPDQQLKQHEGKRTCKKLNKDVSTGQQNYAGLKHDDKKECSEIHRSENCSPSKKSYSNALKSAPRRQEARDIPVNNADELFYVSRTGDNDKSHSFTNSSKKKDPPGKKMLMPAQNAKSTHEGARNIAPIQWNGKSSQTSNEPFHHNKVAFARLNHVTERGSMKVFVNNNEKFPKQKSAHSNVVHENRDKVVNGSPSKHKQQPKMLKKSSSIQKESAESLSSHPSNVEPNTPNRIVTADQDKDPSCRPKTFSTGIVNDACCSPSHPVISATSFSLSQSKSTSKVARKKFHVKEMNSSQISVISPEQMNEIKNSANTDVNIFKLSNYQVSDKSLNDETEYPSLNISPESRSRHNVAEDFQSNKNIVPDSGSKQNIVSTSKSSDIAGPWEANLSFSDVLKKAPQVKKLSRFCNIRCMIQK